MAASRKPRKAVAGKSKPALTDQQRKVVGALKQANEANWIIETHVGLLAAALNGDDLPAGVASETISWHSFDVCRQQFDRLADSLQEMQLLAGIEDPLFNIETDEAAQKVAS